MHKIVNIVVVLALVTALVVALLPQPAYATGENWEAGYIYRKQITFTADTAKIPSTQTNFPVVISLTDSDLKIVANGGHVQNTNGYDIKFTASDGSTDLDYEIEKYNGANGEYVAHIRVPSLATSGIIYMYYDNSSITANPSTTSTWDSNFKMIQHLQETSGTHYDSTVNANNGTPQG